MTAPKTRLCFIAASPFTVNSFLRDHLSALSEEFDVTVITAAQDRLAALQLPACIRVLHLLIARQPAPLADLVALIKLYRLLRGQCFAAVFTITPKAGLLGMLAAFLARVPQRFHYFTGQVWATRSGWRRALLKGCDRLIVALASQVFADGHAQVRFLVEQKVVDATHVQAIGPGPVCGVDLQRFAPNPAYRSEIRTELEIPTGAVVALYLGRMHPEKGILEMAQAFRKLCQEQRNGQLFLLLVGPSDDDNVGLALEQLDVDVKANMRMRGGVADPERYMAAADFLVLPSYREGFPMVVLEAAATELPAVVTDIYGFGDAVVENETAFKVPARDAEQLAAAMQILASNTEMRQRMGIAARRRVAEIYSAPAVTQAWREFFRPLAASQDN